LCGGGVRAKKTGGAPVFWGGSAGLFCQYTRKYYTLHRKVQQKTSAFLPHLQTRKDPVFSDRVLVVAGTGLEPATSGLWSTAAFWRLEKASEPHYFFIVSSSIYICSIKKSNSIFTFRKRKRTGNLPPLPYPKNKLASRYRKFFFLYAEKYLTTPFDINHYIIFYFESVRAK
jgi:hypothetical protein